LLSAFGEERRHAPCGLDRLRHARVKRGQVQNFFKVFGGGAGSERSARMARGFFRRTNPWFVGAACVFAGVAAPFNPQTALFILSVPRAIAKVVLLPAPLRPSSATTSLRSTRNATSNRMWLSP
jgi:hypothetical protein